MTQQDNDQAWNNTVSDPAMEGFIPNQAQNETLEEDNDSPAMPPDDIEPTVAPDHPAMDSGLDAHEQYDVGATNSSAVRAQDETNDEKNQAINGA